MAGEEEERAAWRGDPTSEAPGSLGRSSRQEGFLKEVVLKLNFKSFQNKSDRQGIPGMCKSRELRGHKPCPGTLQQLHRAGPWGLAR